MKTNKIAELLAKQASGNLNFSEKIELAELIQKTDDAELQKLLQSLFNDYEPDFHLSGKEKKKKLESILGKKPNNKNRTMPMTRKYRQAIAVAASLITILASALFLHIYNKQAPAFVAKAIVTAIDTATTFNRNIKLPDGSLVILKAGSTIQVSEQFNQKLREVTLTGEAYFDIAHNKEKPFIIYSGHAKTTVLGTAFNISAWPEQTEIVVSVTRGKVKVECDSELMGILEKNESIHLPTVTDKNLHAQIEESESPAETWIASDLTFDHLTMKEISKIISNRYGVDITIQSDRIAQTEIVSSFNGTDDLNTVLQVLCTIITDCQFKSENGQIKILDEAE
ncbi:MAG: anti-FecI sigma factor, FecR [Bacteroidetes bacterium]|nr:anti-FecI sigma factor, FecR [Bacteroidota bacterium]